MKHLKCWKEPRLSLSALWCCEAQRAHTCAAVPDVAHLFVLLLPSPHRWDITHLIWGGRCHAAWQTTLSLHVNKSVKKRKGNQSAMFVAPEGRTAMVWLAPDCLGLRPAVVLGPSPAPGFWAVHSFPGVAAQLHPLGSVCPNPMADSRRDSVGLRPG